MTPEVQTLILFCLAVLAIGWVLIGGLSLLPAAAGKLTGIWPKVISMTLTVLFVMAAFWLGRIVLVLFLLVLVGRSLYEAVFVALVRAPLAMAEPARKRLAVAAGAIGAGLCYLAGLAPFEVAAPLALVLLGVVCVLLVALRSSRDTGLYAWLEVAAFPGLPLQLFYVSAIQPDYALLAVSAYAMVEIFDSCALLGGQLLGRRKAFPRLSPGKTVEGLMSGAVMLLALSAAVGWFALGISPLSAVATAAIAGVLAVAGDLLASRLKRRSGVKDYPVFAREQGGMLDVFDSWILVAAGLGAAQYLKALI